MGRCLSCSNRDRSRRVPVWVMLHSLGSMRKERTNQNAAWSGQNYSEPCHPSRRVQRCSFVDQTSTPCIFCGHAVHCLKLERCLDYFANTQVAAAAPAATPLGIPSPTGEFTDYPLSEQALLIAQQLTASKQNVPHYYLTVDLK